MGYEVKVKVMLDSSDWTSAQSAPSFLPLVLEQKL